MVILPATFRYLPAAIVEPSLVELRSVRFYDLTAWPEEPRVPWSAWDVSIYMWGSFLEHDTQLRPAGPFATFSVDKPNVKGDRLMVHHKTSGRYEVWYVCGAARQSPSPYLSMFEYEQATRRGLRAVSNEPRRAPYPLVPVIIDVPPIEPLNKKEPAEQDDKPSRPPGKKPRKMSWDD